jgi:hypothetical protein
MLRVRLESEEDADLLRDWQSVFSTAFSQSVDAKHAGGEYRSEKKLPVGFRKDDEREFFESRIMKRGGKEEDGGGGAQVIDPCYPNVPRYVKLVKTIVALQRYVAVCVLRVLLLELGINPKAVIDLTDIEDTVDHDDDNDDDSDIRSRANGGGSVLDVSSSLLRICSYPSTTSGGTPTDSSDGTIAFGSHTDTSVLTLGLVSSEPGLELYDRMEGRWLKGELITAERVELSTPRDLAMTVFVGEVLQILTKAYYRATVHRVRAPMAGTRISCPFIIRGKWGRIINMRNALNLDGEEGTEFTEEDIVLSTHYQHPGGTRALRQHTPDLDGSDISLVHKILDMKRAKCRKKNEGRQEDWVLAAELEVAPN